MNLSAQNLTAGAGLCAATAGAIFVGVQIGHPTIDATNVAGTDLAIRESAKLVMAVLALIGITGLFMRHRDRFGVLGVAGFALLSVGYLAMFANQCIVALVLPTVTETDPAYVQAYIDAAMGKSADVGRMQGLFLASGIGYSLGGLLFGIALYRARVLARWACALLAVATTSALALAALPDGFSRPFAVPTGVALIGLGVSLWRDQRAQTAPVARGLVAEPATR
jgi:hypothetical protein